MLTFQRQRTAKTPVLVQWFGSGATCLLLLLVSSLHEGRINSLILVADALTVSQFPRKTSTFLRKDSNLLVPSQRIGSSSSSSLRRDSRSTHNTVERSSQLCAILPGVENVSDLWTSYNNALETSPLLTKSITASIILGSADLAGQVIESKQQQEDETKGVDVARFIRFAIFGLVLQAPWNHFYYQLLDGAIPPTEDPFTVTTGVKVLIDQFIQAPIFTILIFVFLGTLEGKNTQQIKQQLDDDYVNTMLANWKLFIPATVINLGFVPNLYRVLFLNSVFFFWSIFLSLTLNKDSSSSSSETS